jgi:hypothetical protein
MGVEGIFNPDRGVFDWTKAVFRGQNGTHLQERYKIHLIDTNFGAVEVSSTEPRLNDLCHHLQCIAMQIKF